MLQQESDTTIASLTNKVHFVLAIDRHRHLALSLVKEYRLAARTIGAQVVPALLANTATKLAHCFAGEEALLRRLLTPDDLAAHCREHAQILDQLDELQIRVKNGNPSPTRSALALEALLCRHIATTDPIRRATSHTMPTEHGEAALRSAGAH